jgi:uncharacterized repeat protein (TIGR03943 family)
MNVLENLKRSGLQKTLDALVLIALGALLFKYTITGQLKLLINPNYIGLVWFTAIVLLVAGYLKARECLQGKRASEIQHLSVIPSLWSSWILIAAVILGFLISPKVLTSQTALSRGVSDSSLLTRSQPELFRSFSKPENRSLLDWVRTINAYPEPNAYKGQKAKITGFVIHSPQLPENYLLLSRFVITCCAVDAYPVGIPVKLPVGNKIYPTDSWLEVEGKMEPEVVSGKRQLVLLSQSIKTIPTPSDPYNFSGS